MFRVIFRMTAFAMVSRTREREEEEQEQEQEAAEILAKYKRIYTKSTRSQSEVSA